MKSASLSISMFGSTATWNTPITRRALLPLLVILKRLPDSIQFTHRNASSWRKHIFVFNSFSLVQAKQLISATTTK